MEKALMKIWLLIILFFICVNVYSIDIVYLVTQESTLRRNDVRRSFLKNVAEGEMLFFAGQTGRRSFAREIFDTILVRTEQGVEGWIDSNDVLLKGNRPLQGIIIERRWILSYYQHILFENDKEALFKYEPFWRDDYEAYARRADPYPAPWNFSFMPTQLIMQNNITQIIPLPLYGYISFLHTMQLQSDISTTLQVVCTAITNRVQENHLSRLFDIGEEYLLFLKIDGDYMSVFVNDETNKILSLIGVDDYFIQAILSIVRGDTVDIEKFDISHISWPRRADGAMDFPPPVDMSAYQATHTTTARLRVRDEPTTASLIVTTLDVGAEVQVLETGAMATIDGITAPWVRVLSYNRFTGWVFSGFLQAVYVPEEPASIVAISAELPVPVVSEQGQNNSNTMLFIILGIVGFLVVCISLIIFKKKKNV